MTELTAPLCLFAQLIRMTKKPFPSTQEEQEKYLQEYINLANNIHSLRRVKLL